jgi:hypothetical protein
MGVGENILPPVMNRARSASALAGVAFLVLDGGDVAASVTGELAPTVSVGVTSNATATQLGNHDEIATVGAFHRLRIEQPRLHHEIIARLALAHFFSGAGTDTVTAAAGYAGTFDLTRDLDLRLMANGALSRTSQLDLVALATGGAAATGAAAYVSSSAGQSFTWRATPAWQLSQGADFTRIDYLEEGVTARPTATAIGGTARVDYRLLLTSFSLEGRATDLSSGPVPMIGLFPAIPAGHSVLGEALLGLRRDFNREWSGELRGGVGYLHVRGGQSAWSPAGSGTVNFRRELWFLTLTASRTTVANMFQAFATLNDSVFLRLTLPLDRSERIVIGGFAGISFADTIDTTGAQVDAYDQRTIGARLGARLRELPIVLAVDYTFVDQVGYPGAATVGLSAQSFMRHTVFLTAATTFQWGPGTPPFLGAGLYTPQTQN